MKNGRTLTLAICVFLAVFAFSEVAHAEKTTRTVLYIGSSANLNWVGVDGASINEDGCTICNEICWDATTDEGKRWLSLILAAYLNGDSVQFNIENCFNGKPTFNFINIGK